MQRLDEFQISPRVTVARGSRVRFVGLGPVWNGGGARLPGVFIVRSIFRKGQRVWLEALGPAGTYLVFVSGRAYRRPDVPEVLWRPYKVRRVAARRKRKVAS